MTESETNTFDYCRLGLEGEIVRCKKVTNEADNITNTVGN